MPSLTILNQGSSTNITGLSPITGAVSVTDEVIIYDASAAGNRKATVQELVPDGFLSADATGRAKMADGFVDYSKVAAGSVVQVGHYAYTTLNSTYAVISYVDSIPSVSAGAELFSTTFTPLLDNSRVLVRLSVPLVTAGAAANSSFALFRGSTCLGVAANAPAGGNYPFGVYLEVLDLPAAASPQTYSVRFGTNGGNYLAVNGYTTRLFGGAAAATITFTEIKA